MKRKIKRYAIYNSCYVEMPIEKTVWYDTNDSDMRFLHDITNDEYIRIPWANPTNRDLESFIIGYCFGKSQRIEFEYNIIEIEI